jgi:hypothetical protein
MEANGTSLSGFAAGLSLLWLKPRLQNGLNSTKESDENYDCEPDILHVCSMVKFEI